MKVSAQRLSLAINATINREMGTAIWVSRLLEDAKSFQSLLISTSLVEARKMAMDETEMDANHHCGCNPISAVMDINMLTAPSEVINPKNLLLVCLALIMYTLVDRVEANNQYRFGPSGWSPN